MPLDKSENSAANAGRGFLNFLKTIYTGFKFAASALVGPALAVTSIAILGTAYLAVEAANKTHAHIKHVAGGGTELRPESGLQAASNFLLGSLKSSVGFSLFAYTKSAEVLQDTWGNQTAVQGTGHSADEKYSESNAQALSSNTIETKKNAAQNIAQSSGGPNSTSTEASGPSPSPQQPSASPLDKKKKKWFGRV